MKAANELFHTLLNELSNCDWTFDGREIEKVASDEERGELFLALHDGPTLVIKVEERKLMGWQYCQSCQRIQPGWPDDWRNIGDKGLKYACALCVTLHHDLESGGKPQ